MNLLRKPWFAALLGAFFYWLSLPPMHFPWAAYLACGCWITLVAKTETISPREYWSIWLASAICWLALLQGIRLAYWPLYAGWIALSLYLAVYLPLFIGLSRTLHHRYRVSLPIAVSVVWVGCELVRAYFATGFAACMLAHSQTPWPGMLQIASQFGAYGVSFLVIMLSAVGYQWIQAIGVHFRWFQAEKVKGNWAVRFVHSAVILALILVSLAYDRSYQAWIDSQKPIKPLGRILLIQEDLPTIFDGDYSDSQIGWQRYEQQTSLAAKSLDPQERVDLVVWPESTFNGGIPRLDWDQSPGVPPEFEESESEFEYRFSKLNSNHQLKLNRIFDSFSGQLPFLLVGSDVLKVRSGKLERYNSALWINPDEPNTVDYYAKGHLVMFGEYIPVVSWFPKLLATFGMGQLASGETAANWHLPSGAVVSPTICFENVLPHVVRSRIAASKSLGNPPDILINITNDGWFRGSSILNHHLANGILAAVENRRPMLIAANHGISAWIDGTGRVQRAWAPLEAGYIDAEPIPDGRWGLWQSIGDWPARILALFAFAPAIEWFSRRFLKWR